jgi:hypothetical protein
LPTPIHTFHRSSFSSFARIEEHTVEVVVLLEVLDLESLWRATAAGARDSVTAEVVVSPAVRHLSAVAVGVAAVAMALVLRELGLGQQVVVDERTFAELALDRDPVLGPVPAHTIAVVLIDLALAATVAHAVGADLVGLAIAGAAVDRDPASEAVRPVAWPVPVVFAITVAVVAQVSVTMAVIAAGAEGLAAVAAASDAGGVDVDTPPARRRRSQTS